MRLESYQCDEVKYSYSINGTYSSNASDYKILEQELINSANKAGYSITPPYNFARHHIVALKDPKAQYSRDVLEALGININSATNALFLPTGKGNTDYIINEIVHNGNHIAEYHKEVERRIQSVLIQYEEELANVTDIKNSDTFNEIINNEQEKEALKKLICDCLAKIKIDMLNGNQDLRLNEEK